MKLFRSRRFDASSRHRQVYSAYEIAYTSVDWLAAVLFTIGSIMFLYDDLMKAGTWLFIIGSVCFALRPSIRLARELHLARLGEAVMEPGNSPDYRRG
ncbi:MULTISPECIES: YrhK family protein [Thalassospira]|uniref:YrhK family protein n=1 Tax=Thalassospira TaxID=168934 RepID=UPI0008DD7222|nr:MULTISPECIES: YrhK family protein [Thalassospira]MAB35128.1 cobalamin biosynthesis protein CobQ [Thalassospira sp.]MCH2275922.1 YrhK family protein [Thalassospira sp.]MDM7976661.1 YrhK family protein [Thalassospira xiamenensis]OHY98601.1 cobalamin biosynthesis protein CobQ [Thalassospira sp. MIT1004]HBS21036.1 cobalamin biosynthesis protein CobQ [Thalassospira sp.]|tara:strand:- start:423 stop:716 length:294 start_codon:yes stop_codon:yes gene_type:complete